MLLTAKKSLSFPTAIYILGSSIMYRKKRIWENKELNVDNPGPSLCVKLRPLKVKEFKRQDQDWNPGHLIQESSAPSSCTCCSHPRALSTIYSSSK